MNSDIPLPPSPAMQSSLHCLRQAFDCAERLQQPLWEFAVETEFSSAFGLSQTEIRCLIGAGYVEHALEITDCGEPTVRNLNRAQCPHGIHFSINGNGQLVRWEFKMPPARKRPQRDMKATRRRR